jgi:hypothetical protein
MIHDLGYVSTKQHGNYVSKMNMGIKQDCTPLVPSEPYYVGVSFPKETIHGNISWLNAYVNKNTTINPIMNAMSSAKAVLHILQQGCNEGAPNFETLDQAIKNISKNIIVVAKKSQTQKRKKPNTKPMSQP